jgi:hypothetical protein
MVLCPDLESDDSERTETVGQLWNIGGGVESVGVLLAES